MVRVRATASSSMSVRAARTSPGCLTRRSPSRRISSIRRSSCSGRGPGDPDDYVAIRCGDGARYAITNTCAANVLGLCQARHARPRQCRIGARARSRRSPRVLGVSVEEAARAILEQRDRQGHSRGRADLVAEYGLDRDQAVLVGEGGGAGALIPFAAERHRAAPRDLAGCRSDFLDRRRAGAGARDGRARHPESDARGSAAHQARSVRRRGPARRRAGERRSHDRGRSAHPARARHRDGRFGDARPQPSQAARRGGSLRDRGGVDGRAGRRYEPSPPRPTACG